MPQKTEIETAPEIIEATPENRGFRTFIRASAARSGAGDSASQIFHMGHSSDCGAGRRDRSVRLELSRLVGIDGRCGGRWPYQLISARMSGYVTKVNVDDNQYVEKARCWRKSIHAIIKWPLRRPERTWLMPRRPPRQAQEPECPCQCSQLEPRARYRPRRRIWNRRGGGRAAQGQLAAARAQLGASGSQ